MGTLSLAAPLVLHLLPSFHHYPAQHNYTKQTVTLTVILTSTFSSTLYRYSSHTQCGLPKRCVIRKLTTLNAIYPPCVELEARNSAVGWHWNTHTFLFYLLTFAITEKHRMMVYDKPKVVVGIEENNKGTLALSEKYTKFLLLTLNSLYS